MTKEEFKKLLNDSADEAFIIIQQIGDINNPIEAWTWCESILDAGMRRRIRENLIGRGRNPYTGKVENHE